MEEKGMGRLGIHSFVWTGGQTQDGLEMALRKTAEHGYRTIDLVLEVVNRFETNLLNTTAQGLKFIEDTGSDYVRLHLDTFHMNIEEANPAAAIRLAGDKIGYFHIGESNRGYLGDGVINFDLFFDALSDIDYKRDIVFESFSTTVVDEGLSLACAIWRKRRGPARRIS
jgi:D-psicose/D-tagatose/L-ribulose 3-epimerase